MQFRKVPMKFLDNSITHCQKVFYKYGLEMFLIGRQELESLVEMPTKSLTGLLI